jgi:hypothetical protein
MNNATIVFDPDAAAELCNLVQKRAELYAVERGCTDAFLDTFGFQARPFYEKLGYRVFGTLENHPAGYRHYFMTKQLNVTD